MVKFVMANTVGYYFFGLIKKIIPACGTKCGTKFVLTSSYIVLKSTLTKFTFF